jgi:mono/diheme cytochrome c family protein
VQDFFVPYLYVMNGQINYIIHASLLLVVATGSLFLLQKIPSSLMSSEPELGCATVSPQTSIALSSKAQQGKTLFMSKCASCHNLFKNTTGPGLNRFTDKEPWTVRQNVYDWVRNPAAFMKKNRYARELKEQYKVMMLAFPDITNEEIDAIVEYINQ